LDAFKNKKRLSDSMAERLLEEAWDWPSRAEYYLSVFKCCVDPRPGVPENFSYLDIAAEDVQFCESPCF